MSAVALALALDADVIAAQRGDREAFTRLVDACRNVVASITLAILRDVVASEDVAQEVFLAAWFNVGKLRNTASFLPWLRQLARNHAHASLRSKVRYRRRHAAWGNADGADGVADAAPNATARLVSEEEARALAEAIDRLPDDTREIVTLYYREGSSARQVADLLEISEDAVKKRLERARTALRDAMLERFAETVRKSAPGAGFTAAVAAALVAASPGTAAAAGAGVATSLGPASKLLALLGGAAVGVGGALTTIVLGVRWQLRRARDEEEERALRRFAAVNIGLVLATATSAVVLVNVTTRTLILAAPWILYFVALLAASLVWFPRIVARRLALERTQDGAAAKRQRRERAFALAGLAIGLVAGIATLLHALAR